MWEVHGSQRVVKNLNQLDKQIRTCYDRAFELLSREPKKGKILKGYKNLRSLPVTSPGGELRILYQLKLEQKIVYVILVGSRKDIYNLLKRSSNI